MGELAGLLIVGTLWFWLLVIAEFILLLTLVENEKYLAAPATLLIFALAMVFFGSGMDVLRWINDNRVMSCIYFVTYFVIGAIYVFPPYVGKWWLFVRDVREKNRDEKYRWLSQWEFNLDRAKQQVLGITKDIANIEAAPNRFNDERVKEIKGALVKAQNYVAALQACDGKMTPELLPFWKEHEKLITCRDWFNRMIPIVKPEPKNFKSRIIAWTVYWPPCLFWTILNDPLRAIGRRIYELGAKTLQRISDSAWKDEDQIGG